MSQTDENSVVEGPSRGSVVTYRRQLEGETRERYRIGVVDGPIAPEPTTGELWVGVRLPRHPASQAIDFIAVSSIVDSRPAPPDHGSAP